MEKTKCGVVYILTNPSFPNYVKIGYADNLENRLQQLNRSVCIPFGFRAYAVLEVNKRLADKDIHNIFDKLNPSLRAKENINGKLRTREFFAIDAESAYEVLASITNLFNTANKVKLMTPTKDQKEDEEIAELVDKKQRAAKATFEMIGVSVGSKVYFENDKSKPAIVKDNKNKVEYMGKEYALSPLLWKLQDEKYGKHDWNGWRYFYYNDKRLNDLRPDQND